MHHLIALSGVGCDLFSSTADGPAIFSWACVFEIGGSQSVDRTKAATSLAGSVKMNRVVVLESAWAFFIVGTCKWNGRTIFLQVQNELTL